MNSALHRWVRVAEVVIVALLAGFAFITWRELSALRRAPVVLPNYVFEVINDDARGPVILSRVSWIAPAGRPEPMQTVTIECRKARMECVESAAAVVFVGDRGLLESMQTVFEVERWSAEEVVTKPAAGPCAMRTLVIEIANRRAISRVSASEEKPGKCAAQPARTLELVAGFQARASEAPR